MKETLKKIKAVALKEYRHIMRDKFTLAMGFGLPLLLIIFFGFIIELNYNKIPIFVKDDSRSAQSRAFVQKLSAGDLFIPVYVSGDDPVKYFERNETAVIINIDRDFGKSVSYPEYGKQAQIQIMLDASDPSKAGLVLSYIPSIISNSYQADQKYEIKTRYLFNGELNSKYLIIPGLIVVIIGLISILLSSLAIAKEWEKGSMELLLSTGISPAEIILGKIFPYMLMSLIGTVVVFAAAKIIFAVPFTGSFIFFFISCCVFITASLGLGIFISVIAKQQLLAMLIAMPVGLLPSMLLSGFIFPIENMPLFFRGLTAILPQRWFMEICRGTFLRSAGFTDLMIPFLALSAFCVFIIVIASKQFKTDLEP
ncbi:MAG: ABC transporter permease [Endomicrobia bacterium]|nr:ABC transporter permease [Endomicrobiia bacterium]MCL2506649.1 ABC transporter permease [Endomicrobiia bacterium]